MPTEDATEDGNLPSAVARHGDRDARGVRFVVETGRGVVNDERAHDDDRGFVGTADLLSAREGVSRRDEHRYVERANAHSRPRLRI